MAKKLICILSLLINLLFCSYSRGQSDSTAKTQLTFNIDDKFAIQNAFQKLQLLPDFILSPKETFSNIFKKNTSFIEAIVFSVCMILIGLSVAWVLSITKKIEMSSIIYIYIGTIVIWIFYAIFLHFFAYWFGANHGIQNTIIAYLYVIGFLQPILAIILYILSKVFQKEVDYREIMTSSLGGSGGGKSIVLARGKFLSGDVVTIYRSISGFLILIYFSIALSEAQQISLVRSSLASLASFIFWIVVYLIIYLASKFLGMKTLLRTLEG